MDHNHPNHHDHSEVKSGYSLKDFAPLAIIFAVIILFTAGAMAWTQNSEVTFGLRMFMAGFFIVFGLFKVVKWRGFADAYSTYDIIAKRSRAYAYLYPLIELGLGISYLVGWNLILTNAVTLVVMSVGALGVAKEIRKKNQVPCACLGTVFKIPMTKVTLVEDLLMAVMALWMILMVG